jgi:hypothetical protein
MPLWEQGSANQTAVGGLLGAGIKAALAASVQAMQRQKQKKRTGLKREGRCAWKEGTAAAAGGAIFV